MELSLLLYQPFRIRYQFKLFGFHLDVYIDTCWHFQSGQCVYCLLGRSGDVDQSLVSSLLKLLSGVFVLVYCTKDGDYFLLGRQRHRSAYLRSVFLYSFALLSSTTSGDCTRSRVYLLTLTSCFPSKPGSPRFPNTIMFLFCDGQF